MSNGSSGGWVESHRRSILFLMVTLAAAGIAASLNLPVSLFPTVDFPRAVISLDAGDRPAEQMEMQVTRPVENAVRRGAGVGYTPPTPTTGAPPVPLQFSPGPPQAGPPLP